MFNSLSRLGLVAKVAAFLCIWTVNQAQAQSIGLEWQQTSSYKDNHLTQFDQYALDGDFQALLFGIEQRDYHHVAHTGQRIGSLKHLKIGIQYYTEISERYSLWPRIQVFAGYDNHTSSDSLTYNPQLVAIRELNDNLSIVAGAGALLHTSQDQYYPVVGIVLNPSGSGRWSGNLTVPEGDLAYRLNDTWSAEAGLKWQTRYYKTDRTLTDTEFLRSKDTLFSFGARADINSNVRLSGHVTYAFLRELRFYADGGRSTEEPASGFGFRLRLAYHF